MEKQDKPTRFYVLGVISIIIGAITVLTGCANDSIAQVIGGGLFMGLGITDFVLTHKFYQDK